MVGYSRSVITMVMRISNTYLVLAALKAFVVTSNVVVGVLWIKRARAVDAEGVVCAVAAINTIEKVVQESRVAVVCLIVWVVGLCMVS